MANSTRPMPVPRREGKEGRLENDTPTPQRGQSSNGSHPGADETTSGAVDLESAHLYAYQGDCSRKL